MYITQSDLNLKLFKNPFQIINLKFRKTSTPSKTFSTISPIERKHLVIKATRRHLEAKVIKINMKSNSPCMKNKSLLIR